MKKFLLPLLLALILGGTAMAQEASPVKLEVFEKCNNWARHYCMSGNHETVVNQELQKLKKNGVPITVARIKMMAQRIKPNTPIAPQPQ